ASGRRADGLPSPRAAGRSRPHPTAYAAPSRITIEASVRVARVMPFIGFDLIPVTANPTVSRGPCGATRMRATAQCNSPKAREEQFAYLPMTGWLRSLRRQKTPRSQVRASSLCSRTQPSERQRDDGPLDEVKQLRPRGNNCGLQWTFGKMHGP